MARHRLTEHLFVGLACVLPLAAGMYLGLELAPEHVRIVKVPVPVVAPLNDLARDPAFRAAMQEIAQAAPLPKGVGVMISIVELKDGRFGDTVRVAPNQYHIRIHRHLDTSIAVYTLAEEWAHVHTYGHRPIHGDEWAIKYAEIVRKVITHEE